MANLTSDIKSNSSTSLCLLYCIVIMFFSQSLLGGGGWPQPKGHGYFKLSEWWTIANEHYTSTGLTDPNVTAGLYNTTFYGEYGLSDNFTAILNLPLFSRSVINNVVSATTNEIISEGGAISTLGDADFSLKYGLFNNGFMALSATALFGLPLGEDAGGQEGNLQTGDGEFNQMIKIDAGFSLANTPNLSAYGNIYGGFNQRNKGFSDEFRFGAEVGLGFANQKFWLTGKLDILESRNNEESGQVEGASFFASNSEFQSFTVEASYFVTEKVGIAVSAATAFSGRIIYSGKSYSIGVFMKI